MHAECFRFLNQLVHKKVLSQVDFSCAKLKERVMRNLLCFKLSSKSKVMVDISFWHEYVIEIWRLNKYTSLHIHFSFIIVIINFSIKSKYSWVWTRQKMLLGKKAKATAAANNQYKYWSVWLWASKGHA